MVDTAVVSGAPAGILRRLFRRKLALFGFAIIFIVVGSAIFAPWLVRYGPNEQLFDGLTLQGAPMPPRSGIFNRRIMAPFVGLDAGFPSVA